MISRIILASGALALVIGTLVPSSAAAQRDRWKSEPTRVSGYFTLQACCDAHLVDNDATDFLDLSTDASTDPGFGFGVRVERRVLDFLALGGMFEMLAWRLDGDDDREFFIDADVFARLPLDIDLSGDLGLEIYALLPVGFTAAFQDENDRSRRALGVNLGLLGGAMVSFDTFGLFAEFGFRHHSVFDDVEGRDFRLGLTQVAFNLGGSVAF